MILFHFSIILIFPSVVNLTLFSNYHFYLIPPALVTSFNLEIGITGAILTKLDGDSRGGAALSIKEV